MFLRLSRQKQIIGSIIVAVFFVVFVAGISVSEAFFWLRKTDTSVLGQATGAVRGDFENAILKHFPRETGYSVNTTFRGCFDSSDDFWAGPKEGELRADVLMSYGRTGQAPTTTDIYGAWEASRPLLKPMHGYIELRPEFAELVDPEGHFQRPFVDTMVIIYNPKLIDRKDVPKSWAGLAEFDDTVAVPAWGCFAMRTLTYLYSIVDKEKFEQIIKNGRIPALVLDRDDPRSNRDNPLAASCVVKAVLCTESREIRRGLVGKDIAVGIGSLQGAEVRQGLKGGILGVIWPKEGAMAFPYSFAIRKDPVSADLALLEFLVKGETMQEVIFNGGWSSTLVDGPVHPIVKENNFRYYFVSIERLMDKATHQRIVEIVEKHSPYKRP